MAINGNLFKAERPNLNPFTSAYAKFWREEKRRCIEGYWVGNNYMPGIIYFYINYWNIKKQLGKKGKGEVLGHPNLRDIEWEKGYIFLEARGFSGFEDDKEFTANNQYKEEGVDPEGRKYIHPREYLRKFYSKQLGKPLYHNEAKNVVEIGGRGYGKSYFTACCIAYVFLFDGAIDYDEYLENVKNNTPLTAEVVVGAIDTKYSNDLLSKVQLGLDNLPGKIEYNKISYPSPFSKTYAGSFQSGKYIIAKQSIKSGGSWETQGSASKIHHRSFAESPTAANGTRPAFVALEEVGFMHNLIPALGSLNDCTSVGGNKFGTTWMFGTGGEMASGATEAVKAVFYEPEAFDCLSFKDEYEDKGNIGLFFPAYYKFDKYRDENGIVDKDKGILELETTRAKLAKANDKEPLNRELQNNPLLPSEAFLVTEGNLFPIAELRDQLNFLESESLVNSDVKGMKGRLVLEDQFRVKFIPDTDNSLRACNYPLRSTDDKTGCIVIWEHPIKNAQETNYLYLAGTDPYDQDESNNSPSLGSTFVIKRAAVGLATYDMIVAEYTGRPKTAKEHHENVRRLMLYYNARNLYENERNSLKMHFEFEKSLYLLMNEPTVLKSVANTNVSRKYGTHMTKDIKTELEIYTRDWLMTPVEGSRLNLHYVYSIPLIKELISYNRDGNFDRVIAFMLAICAKLQYTQIQAKQREEKQPNTFFTKKLFTNSNSGWLS